MDELKKLTDDELLSATRLCAEEERAVTLRLLKYLDEVDRRKLYLARGFPSLYEYVRKGLNLSEGSAYRRIASMRLLRDVPEIEPQIESGELPLTSAAKIQAAMRGKPKAAMEEMASACVGKSTREVERTIAEAQPEEQKEYTRWLSGDQVRLTIHLDKESFINLTDLKALRSHAPWAKTFGGVVSALIDLGQAEWDPLKRNATSALKSHCNNKSREIPSTTRTFIWQRDEGNCTYVDPETKTRCGSRHYVQMDHIVPIALGGTNDPENLRLLCGPHNRRRAEKTFGPRPKP